jgi:hypothetical protein
MNYQKDDWQWWRDNLAGKTVPMHDVPMQGFYALKRSSKAAPEPVAVWYKGGAVNMKVGNDLKTVEWVWIARNPIPHDVYKAVMAGEPWPHEVRITLADGSVDSTLGSNTAGEDRDVLDDVDEWTRRADAAKKKGAPDTQEDADALSDIATKLAELKDAADKKRLATTKPLRDRVDEINEDFNKKIRPATIAVADLKTLIGIFQKKERDRRAAEAKVAEEAAKAAGAENVTIAAAPVRSGTRGKSVSLVKVAVVKYDESGGAMKAAQHLVETAHEGFRTELDRIVLYLLRAGAKVPGATLDYEERAR